MGEAGRKDRREWRVRFVDGKTVDKAFILSRQSTIAEFGSQAVDRESRHVN